MSYCKGTFRESVAGINQMVDKHLGFCRMERVFFVSLNVVYPPFYVTIRLQRWLYVWHLSTAGASAALLSREA